MALTKITGEGIGTIDSADIDGAVTINESGASKDFRVETDGKTHAFFVDGSADNIAMGTTTPTFATGNGLHLGDDFHIGYGDGNGTRPDFQMGYDATNTRFSVKCGTGSDDSDAIITTGGRFGIGTTNTTARVNIQFAHSASEQGIRITPDGTTATMIRFDNSGGVEKGSITTSGSATAFNTSSDYRLKENVSYNWDATSRLKQLKPARFNWIDDDTNTLVDGFLAHEVSNIVPESITGDKDEVDESKNPVYQGIDQSKLVPLLVKTIQELEARVTALESA